MITTTLFIAARLDTPRQVASTWRKRFCERRMAGWATCRGMADPGFRR